MRFELFVVLLVVAVYTTASNQNLEDEWKAFKLKYGKQYRNSVEENTRKRIFANNLDVVGEHNELYNQNLVTYSMKIHQYSDMSTDEISKTLNGYKASPRSRRRSKFEEVPFTPDEGQEIPDEIDWRKKGAVTPVKDQRYCGSCWAFSATGALEGQYFLKSGKLVSLSEQNILDCSTQHNNHACFGGDMIPAFDYVNINDGIDSDEAYPYKGYRDFCTYEVSANVTSLKGYMSIKRGNEDYLKAAVAIHGPVSVTIDAEQSSFHNYASGVHYNPSCIEGINDPEDELNHGVLVVGYGTENGMDYWLVKNSWGPTWGDNGYIKMARNKNNNCGIVSLASQPIMY